MHHFFSGLTVAPLAAVPFRSPSLGARCFEARELGWDLELRQPACFLPCVGGFVGSDPSEEHLKVFTVVRDARDAAIEFVREAVAAGREIKGAEVDDVSRGVIERAGYGQYFTHRTGHSIGEEVHGNGAHIDNLETRDSRKIIPRTCFSIEPGIYLPGNFGVRSEIDLYVGDGGRIEVTGQPIQTELVRILKD